MNLVTSHY